MVGDVVATHRHENLGNKKLLLVRRLDLDGAEEGHEIIALDTIGVGRGEDVLVVQEGGAARQLHNDKKIPAQAVVVGVIDHFDVDQSLRDPEPKARK